MGKILIVDDDPLNRDILRARLEMAGHEVHEAVDGEDGFKKSKEERPDLIFTDVMMPKMNGLTLCHILKHDAMTQGIPVVILTAGGDEIERHEQSEAGADAYLSKPCPPQLLNQMIEKFIAPV
jgi:twitching motility two-component system response regulator PilH